MIFDLDRKYSDCISRQHVLYCAMCCRNKINQVVPCCIIFQCSYVLTTRFSEGDSGQVSLCVLCLLEFIFLLASVTLCWPFEGLGGCHVYVVCKLVGRLPLCVPL